MRPRGTAARRAAVRAAAEAADRCIEKLKTENAMLREKVKALQPTPGSVLDREVASRPMLESQLYGYPTQHEDRLRRNTAQHALYAPQNGFASATVGELKKVQKGPRLCASYGKWDHGQASSNQSRSSYGVGNGIFAEFYATLCDKRAMF